MPPAVPSVAAGWPTGPCVTAPGVTVTREVVVGLLVVVVEAVGDVVGDVPGDVPEDVRVCLSRGLDLVG